MNEDVIKWAVCDKCKRDYPIGRIIETTEDLVNDGKAMRDWVDRLLCQIHALEIENANLKDGQTIKNAFRDAEDLCSDVIEENQRLKAKLSKLKETLMPVLEYGADIYNRGVPQTKMPEDTIQRLNWAFKMFGG